MRMKFGSVALSAGLVVIACGAPAVQAQGAPESQARGAPIATATSRADAPVTPPVAGAAQAPGALSPTQVAALAEVRGEKIFGSPIDHFTVSNEYRHDLWFDDLRGLGGAYVGVASDQNYTLIATARSEIAYLIDLDRQVVDLHGIYASLISVAPDPAAFMALLGGFMWLRIHPEERLTEDSAEH